MQKKSGLHLVYCVLQMLLIIILGRKLDTKLYLCLITFQFVTLLFYCNGV